MPIVDPTHDARNTRWCPIVELRQYALHPGRREDLIQLFDERFIESQEAVGLTVMGQFRDLDNVDSFVWLRGFTGMDVRPTSLAAFYDGPVWAANKDRANATMIDSDNVLLLRSPRPASGFNKVDRPDLQVARDRERGGALLLATIYSLERPAEESFLDFFEVEFAAALREAGGSIDACYTSAPGRNNFPRLPVREDDRVLVWFATFPDIDHCRDFERRVSALPTPVSNRLDAFLLREPETHRLVPTTRSRLPQA